MNKNVILLLRIVSLMSLATAGPICPAEIGISNFEKAVQAIEQNLSGKEVADILDSVIDINERDSEGNTLLRIALLKEAPDEIIALLLTKGADTQHLATNYVYAVTQLERKRLQAIQVGQEKQQDDDSTEVGEIAVIATLAVGDSLYELQVENSGLYLNIPSVKKPIFLNDPFFMGDKPVKIDGKVLEGKITGAIMQLKDDGSASGPMLYTLVELDTTDYTDYAVLYGHNSYSGIRFNKVGLRIPINNLKRGLSVQHNIPQDVQRKFLEHLQSGAQKKRTEMEKVLMDSFFDLPQVCAKLIAETVFGR